MGTRRSLTGFLWGTLPFLALIPPSTELNVQGMPDEESPLAQVFDRLLVWHLWRHDDEGNAATPSRRDPGEASPPEGRRP